MTNGEKLKEIFPDIEFTDMAFTVHAVAEVNSNGIKGHISYDFWKYWWNAEYKEPTTKNDLGVDCISRKFMRYLGATCIAYRNDKQKLIPIISIDELPPATPQEPRWILVSERLPEYGISVIGSAKDGTVYPEVRVRKDSSGKEYWEYPAELEADWWERLYEMYADEYIVAWMPLPDPFKPQESEDQE